MIKAWIDQGRITKFSAPSPLQPGIQCHQNTCGCRRTRFIWVSHPLQAIYFDVPKAASSSIRSILGVHGAHAYLNSSARAVSRFLEINPETLVDIEVGNMQNISQVIDSVLRNPEFSIKFKGKKIIKELFFVKRIDPNDFMRAIRTQMRLIRQGEFTVDSPEYTSPYQFRLLDLTPEEAINQYPGYFSFGFTRNPWKRIESVYRMVFSSHRDQKQHPIADELFCRSHRGLSFSDFIEKIRYIRNCHWEQAVNFFPLDEKGIIQLDFIGRIENIQNDWKFISDQLNLPKKLPRLKKSSKQQELLWTEELVEIIRKHFKADIAAFNYSPPSVR